MVAKYPSFATPEQYAALTGDTPPDNIQDLLDAASSSIRRYCGWHISPVVTEDVTVDGSGGRTLSLPTLQLLDVTGITEQWSTGTGYAYATGEIQWSRNGYLQKGAGGLWTAALRGVTATIKHGFETADVGDLSQMVITMAARGIASPYGTTQETVGAVTVRMSTSSASGGSAGGIAIDSAQADYLDLYRVFGRA